MVNFTLEQIEQLSDKLQSISTKSINIVRCEYNDHTQWVLSSHKHDYLEIVYYLKGRIHLVSRCNDCNINPFEILIHPENMEHAGIYSGLQEQPEVIRIGVNIPGGSKITQELCLKDLDGRLKWLFTEILNNYQKKGSTRNIVIKRLLDLIFIYLADLCRNGSIVSHDPIEIAVNFIRANLVNKISVPKLAMMVGLSSSHFTRLFHSRVGKTPIQFINFMRIEVAKLLLINIEVTVDFIAAQTGFNDSKYFCRTFKQITGISPSEYRELNKKDSSGIKILSEK